jgi:hypothetical protein
MTPAGRGRRHALSQLLAGGAAMVVVGGAWPALVELTPAADRPWVAGTSDNSVLSLIFGYNGLGRVEGQTGGPGALGGRGGGGGSSALFGSSPGPFRLLNSALGGQAGWLLGFALVSGLAILVATRLRRSDPRSGWLIAVGGAFLVTAVLFSAASGIFHPYYVSLLAPFTAALFGAGAAQLIGGRLRARIAGPLAIVAGVAVELVIRGQYPGQLTWLDPVLIAVGAVAVLALVAFRSRRVRVVAVGAVTGALLLAPSVWAIDTLGYPTSATFPSGGPAAVAGGGGAGGLFARVGAGGGLSGPPGRGFGAGAAGQQLFGTGGSPPATGGRPPGGLQGAPPAGAGGGALGPGGAGGGGRFGGDESLTAVVSYVKQHGGGTIAVASQSSAASAIIKGDVQVAGIGGFSGRESDVSVSWLAQEVRSGAIRWVLVSQTGGGFGAGAPGDTRTGSKAAMDAVAKVCRQVTLPATSSSTGAVGSGAAAAGTLYDCQGSSAALEAAGARAS